MKPIDRRRSLAAIPVLREGVTAEAMDGGGIRLKTRIVRGSGFFERFRPPVTEKSYELDRFGAFVVGRIDGKATVLQIVEAFQEHFKLSHRESELGVVAFMKTLLQRNLLAIVERDPKG